MTTGLLGPDGQPVSQYYAQKRGPGRPRHPKPIMGEAFGNWAGRDSEFLNLPGGGAITFDTSRLTLANYRKMAEHYQIASSINLLTFMMQQLDWHIVCEDKQIEEHCTYNMNLIWTRLLRSMSSSFTFGFSPNVLQYENDPYTGRVIITKVKDLVHEEVSVNWKEVPGYAPPGHIAPKVKVFDGIRQLGSSVPIPVSNSFWYPLLMQHGNYGGRKLLNTAFQPWFFSSLIHLYQNRYFERFGEPVPIGRAPYDDRIRVGGSEMAGSDLMANVLSMIKNRSAVVLPNDTTPQENGTDKYDYTVEYLESQMRGADFEVYLKRLDEEMSLALFTPLLLMRTADGGGFNQGVSHQQQFLWILNAIAEDFKEYIDRYILIPLSIYAFGPKAKRPEIKFRKLGKAQQETLRAVVQTLLQGGKITANVEELGQHVGLTLYESEDDKEGSEISGTGGTDNRVGRPERLRNDDLPNVTNTRATTRQLSENIKGRVSQQVKKAFRDGTFGEGFMPDFGFGRQLHDAFEASGHNDPDGALAMFRERAGSAIAEIAALGRDEYDPESFMGDAGAIIDAAIQLASGSGDE